jgi:hypothetical protein
MTDPQPMDTVGTPSSLDVSDKMDLDQPAVSSSSAPPSSSVAVAGSSGGQGETDAVTTTLQNAPPPSTTDDKKASSDANAASLQHQTTQVDGDEIGSPKPKIKISLRVSGSGGDAGKKSNGKASSSSSSTKKTKEGSKTTTASKPSLLKRSSSSGSHSSSKTYQGNLLRSATAAHRKDKIAIPPIGSPGLLMMPNPALTACFPKDIDSPEELKKWLYNGQYLLPATVFRRAMEVGGYTAQQRVEHPHRGSSTERCVGDMFDSDVGGLYLHFPELIPRRVWDRRLGGDVDDYDDIDDDMDDFPVRDRRKRRRRSSSKGRRGSRGSSDANGNSRSKEHHSGVKGARSSYIFFTHEMRSKMVNEFPGMKFTEQGIIMGERWRALTPEQKKPYEDMANEDKKRYATEWAAYLETVKKEIREEKEGGKKKDEEGDDDTNKDEEEADDGDDDDEEQEEEETEVKPVVVKKVTSKNKAKIKGPRLVDAVILSLCNIVGEKAYRTEPLPPMPPKDLTESLPLAVTANAEQSTTDSKSIDAISPEKPPSSDANMGVTADEPKSDSKPSPTTTSGPTNPDLIISDSNLATTNDAADAKLQPPKAVSDLLLEELPKLNPAMPQTRKRNRPHEPMSFLDMIPTSLTCTYPREYVDKRRAYAEAVIAREEAIIASQEAKDDADDAKEKYLAHTEAWDRMLEYQKQQIAKRAAERKRQKEKNEAEKKSDNDGDTTATGIESSNEDDVKEEDPMDCMPPRPSSPPPARIVSIPDIPKPPTPPQLLESDGDDIGTVGHDNDATVMRVSKRKAELLKHLDPDCFVPDMTGRYFGLFSNGIADPNFVGPTSTGIRGTTFGGGTGLATSYVGGGRGASGLVSGPSRSSVGSRASLAVLANEDISSSAEVTPKAAKKRKRSVTTPPSKKKDKKESKKVCLATGDRITSAIEVSSGPAGPEFPEGWVVKTYRRSGGETIGKTDRFWFSPGLNIRFRAKKHAKQFVDILQEKSINGDEDIAAAEYKKRGLHF